MRIAVNARFLLKDRLEGLGRFSDEVIKRLVQMRKEDEFVLFFDRAYDPQFVYGDNVIPVSVPPQARHPYLYPIWFNYSLPWQFKKFQPGLFFSPDGFLSLRTEIPQLPVIHDLAFEHYPEYVSKTGARYYKKNFPLFAHKAARIATVSEFSKEDIHTCYGINPDQIDVVYNGASSLFSRLDEESLANFKQEKMQGRPWFVYVGALHPRKNIGRLLEAFDAFKHNDNQGYRLVIIGRKAWQTEEL
ncbi:MAG: glycosyltransferase, partial [Bacteroidota bacterium]|nr:glycosyltransferase [Bacteroidota bacterium]MDX5430176.1 glycosyltransferase [Bacteroidota bacterium]MDX5468939.1 glycosyltransferase [Bacteroidota bacterium]